MKTTLFSPPYDSKPLVTDAQTTNLTIDTLRPQSELAEEHKALLAADPFALGWRIVTRTRPDGETYQEQIPLTPKDILHPELGDYQVHNSVHSQFCRYIDEVLSVKTYHDPHTVVIQDVRIVWDTPGMNPHSPDICVIPGVRQVKEWPTFDVAQEGTKPSLVIEVTSPSTRQADLEDKVSDYAVVGVPFYIIVDTKEEKGQRKRVLLGYCLNQQGVYETMTADERGRLWLPPVGLWMGIEDNKPVFYDEDGNRIAGYEEVSAALAETTERLDAETEARREEVISTIQQVTALRFGSKPDQFDEVLHGLSMADLKQLHGLVFTVETLVEFEARVESGG